MKIMLITLGLIMLNTATAVAVVYTQYEKRQIGMQMSEEERARDEVKGRWTQLLVEYAAQSSNLRIEKIATEQLNMKHVYDNVVFVRF